MKIIRFVQRKADNLVTLFKLLNRFRFVSLDQLEAYFGQGMPDLSPLIKEKIILELKVPSLTTSMRLVYTLGRRGAEILALQIDREINSITYFTRHKLKRSVFTVDHDLAISQVGMALAILEKQSKNCSLKSWQTNSKGIATYTSLPSPSGMIRVPLVADALFCLEHEGEKAWFLLEQDRGTVSTNRMRMKFKAYKQWWKQGGPKQFFGVKNLRLLVLAPSEKRLVGLIKASMDKKEKGSGFIWFGLQSFADLKSPAKRFLGEVWQTAGQDNTLRSLFPRRTGPQPRP